MSQKLHKNQKDKIATEMYLKTIYMYEQQHNKKARLIDLARELSLSKSSVSEMIKKLSEKKLIEYESFSIIKLTEKGSEKAKNITKKYNTIKRFLIEVLKVNNKDAHHEACNLEHAFSDKSIKKLEKLVK